MQPINILIADDEMPARDELRYILEMFLPEATFHEATDGHQAVALVTSTPIDVLFLDINMPGLDGLAAAAALLEKPSPPLIIFATAYDQHALRAFELAALDYVVKPFDERRLSQTVARIRQMLAERKKLEEQQALMRVYLQDRLSAADLPKLWGERENENRVPVDYRDILWVEATNKRVYMTTAQGEKLLLRQSLKEVEARLSQQNFARVHKSYLVNLDHVVEVVPWFSGGYVMRMADEERTELPVSRRYAAQLKKETGLY